MTAETFRIMFAALSFHVFHVFVDGFVLVCLYKSASRMRTTSVRFTISNIDFTLCTHYVYGYATVDSRVKNIVPVSPHAEEGPTGLYNEFNKAKNIHPWIKTILSIGGPEFAIDLALRTLAGSETPPFKTFSQNAVMFVRTNNFDGLDVDWQYPPGAVSKETFNKLLQELRTEIDKEETFPKLLLTATVRGIPYQVRQAYDVPTIGKYVDYVFVKSFDLIFNNTLATFSAPLYHRPNSTLHPDLNVNASIRTWNTMGMPYNKTVVGVTTLGPYVRLAVTHLYLPGSPATSAVLTGPLYHIPSRLAYPEICLKIQMRNYSTFHDSVQQVAYLVKGFEWIGHETFDTLDQKIWFVRRLKPAGIFYSSMDEDDFNGTICNEGRYPVVSFIKAKLPRPVTTRPTAETTTTAAAANGAQTDSGRPRRTTYAYIPEDDDYTPRLLSVWAIVILVALFVSGCGLGFIVTSLARKKFRRTVQQQE